MRSENCLSSGYSTEEEGANPKQDKDPVLPDMSGFYYATQQHHRDGPKPRGRPPFSHKAAKSFSERRGRSVGRAPGRSSAIRYRDIHEEHGYDPLRKSHSPHYRHGEMPRQGRYGSPSRISKRNEEIETENVSTAPKNTPSKTSVTNEETSAVAKLAKMQRRDTPREKQRLTQDLARQKRLLSEDLARAELLHREQLSKKLDKNEIKDQTQECQDINDLSREDLQNLSHIHEDTRTDKIKTMYEKVYGRLSPDTSDHVKFDEVLTEEPRKDKNLNYDQERKSLFERYKISKDTVEEMKTIEFVNEAKVEVRGTSCCLQESVNGVMDTNVTQKLEPLKFENVTDDELIPNDTDTGENPGNCLPFGAVNGEFVDHSVTSNHDSGNTLHLLDKSRMSPSERTNNSASDSERSATSADLNQKTNFEKIDCINCECVNSEMEEDGSNCSVNNSDKSYKSELENNPDYSNISPDHSNIKGVSKLEQLLEEPDMQCKHSSKKCDEAKEANINQSQENGTESDASAGFIETTDNCGTQLENNADNAEVSEVTGAENNISETAMTSPIATPTQHIKPVNNEKHATESRPGDVDTDISHNEGMSDAEELSDPDIYPAIQREKVKKRRKRKHKTSKTHTNSSLKSSNINSSLKGKSKSGRTGGRGKKSNRKPKPIQDSDSDDAFSYLTSPKTKEDSIARDGNRENQRPYQGPMVKEDSSSDPPPVLFEDSADINGTFDAAEEKCCSSNREADKQIVNEKNIISMDDEDKKENTTESDKNCKTAEGIPSTKIDQHNSVGEADDSGQEIFSLTTAERQMFEEQERKEKVRKEKRFAARQKRRNEEQKDTERSTPPHLVSQNRFARDLPRHNWLVERLLQQNQLCEDTLNEESTTINDEQGEQGGEDLSTIRKDNNDRNEISESIDESPKVSQERESEGCDSSDEDSSSAKDEFQSELHRSFLRRRYPSNVPCGPPKLKPAAPDNIKISGSGPPPLNSLKHKLLSPKEYPTMEPIPKLRKISDDCDKSDSSVDTIKIEPHLDLKAIQPQNADVEKLEEANSNENESLQNKIMPIEVLNSDDEKERKNDCGELKEYVEAEQFHEEEKTENKVAKTDSNENLSLSTGREPFNFSSPKKPIAQKMVNSVSPTVLSTKPKNMQSSKDKLSPSMHMSPHHRAAILVPLMPVHEGGPPFPPSLGPPSPHMKGYPPRTFAPHLISHSSSAIQPAGLFQSQHSPSGRYSGNSCMHHLHGGLKSGIPCKPDVNCPFHGSTPRGMHSGILGIPSHHAPIPAFSQHSHISEHMPPIFSGEHREGEKNPCTYPDCKPCHAGKESPCSKYRDTELGSSSKISPQIPKVVKPIAHVPGKRPPLMLSHLQQPLHSSRHPPNIEGYHSEKDRRPPSGLDSLLPRNQQKSPDKSVRERITSGFHHLSDKRQFNHPLTLSELNRRREEDEILKTRIGERGPEHRHRPGDLALPRLSPPRSSSKFSGIFSTMDSTTLTPNRSPPLKESEMLRRFGKERERTLLLPEHLKTGPPRLRSVGDSRDLNDLRLIADRQKREDVTLRDNVLSKESQVMLRQVRSKETASPEAKPFAEKSAAEQAREDSHGRILELPSSRLHPIHGNTGVFSLANPAHSLGELHKNIDEARKNVVVEEQGFQDLRNSKLGPSHRNYRPGDKNVGIHELERRRVDIVHSNEPEEKELVDKERQNRSPSSEREKQGKRLSDRDKSPFRLPNMSPPTLRKDVFGDRVLAMDPRGRPPHRLVTRGVSLQELEIHRRREDLRGVEPSHRELLSRMAMSSRNAVPQLLHPFPERKEGTFEGPEHLRVPLGLRRGSPPRGIPATSSSRLAVERLAAAAAQAKPGILLSEKSKDVPPHLREVSAWRVSAFLKLSCFLYLIIKP